MRVINARIPALLEFAGLANRAGDNIRTLSGGMKRRLTLARALINDPDLIFLDEPTTGLDPQARHLIWQRLRQLLAQGKTIFLTTHFMDEAERLCHRLAIMDHGRIIAGGTPRELVATHIEPQVVEVFGDGAEAWANAHGARLARALRENRRDGVLLRARCRAAAARSGRAARTALPAPPRQSRRRVPAADRPRSARLT